MKRFLLQSIVLILLSLGSLSAQIDPLIRITPEVDTVDFGIVLLGEKSLQDFFINNGSSNPIRFGGNITPWFQIRNNGEDNEDRFRQFKSTIQTLPEVTIPSNGEHKITLEYVPNDNVSSPGNYADAQFTLAVTPTSSMQVNQTRTFLLLGYRSKTWLGTRITKYSFDSVYVNTTTPKVYRWNLLNLSTNLITTTTDISYYTPNDSEFSFASNNPIPSKESREIELLYRPKGRGFDSARFWLQYERSGNVETLPIELSGVGVEQVITTTSVTIDGTPITPTETINLGDMNWGTKKNVMLRFKNDGNIEYTVQNQTLQSFKNANQITTISSIVTPYPTSVIKTSEEYSIILEITPSALGQHTTELVLGTNLLSRGFHGVNPLDATKKIVFSINGVGASLQVNLDTIDLGDVPISQQSPCRLNSSRSVQIKNIGSTNLNISSATIPTTFSPFRIASQGNSNVSPDAVTNLTVEFEPANTGEFLDSLEVVSNSITGAKKVVYLRGRGVQAQTVSPRFDEYSVKPGSDVFIPLRITSSLEGITSIQQQLQYDPQILEYKGYFIAGTKLQNTPQQFISIAESTRGILPISINAPNSNYLTSDTLVMLHFGVYLGEKRTTLLQFVLAQFGNSTCPNFLTVGPISGRVTVDSICGLDYKTTLSTLAIGMISPNPIGNEFLLPIESYEAQSITISVLNTLGTVLFEEQLTLEQGTMLVPIQLKNKVHKGLIVVAIRTKSGIVQQLLIKE